MGTLVDLQQTQVVQQPRSIFVTRCNRRIELALETINDLNEELKRQPFAFGLKRGM
jgi:hypothetical protein